MRGLLHSALLSGVALGLATAVASAQGRTVTDALSVPEGTTCLRHAELATHVRAWLRHDEVPASTSILVVDERGDERHDVAFVLLRGEEPVARRTFPVLPEGCNDRRAALGLAIALAVDASVLESLGVAVPIETRPPPEVAPRQHPSSRPTPDPTPEVREPSSVQLALATRVGVLVGVLPEPAMFGGAAVELRGRDAWAVRVGGSGSSSVDTALGSGIASSQLVSGRIDGCLLLRGGETSVEGCTGVAAGILFAEGRGYDEPRSSNLEWVAGVLRLGARYPADGWLAVQGGVDGLVSVLRPRLQVHGTDGSVRHQTTIPAAGASADVGIEVAFR